jgi:hypothetical protein
LHSSRSYCQEKTTRKGRCWLCAYRKELDKCDNIEGGRIVLQQSFYAACCGYS